MPYGFLINLIYDIKFRVGMGVEVCMFVLWEGLLCGEYVKAWMYEYVGIMPIDANLFDV